MSEILIFILSQRVKWSMLIFLIFNLELSLTFLLVYSIALLSKFGYARLFQTLCKDQNTSLQNLIQFYPGLRQKPPPCLLAITIRHSDKPGNITVCAGLRVDILHTSSSCSSSSSWWSSSDGETPKSASSFSNPIEKKYQCHHYVLSITEFILIRREV